MSPNECALWLTAAYFSPSVFSLTFLIFFLSYFGFLTSHDERGRSGNVLRDKETAFDLASCASIGRSNYEDRVLWLVLLLFPKITSFWLRRVTIHIWSHVIRLLGSTTFASFVQRNRRRAASVNRFIRITKAAWEYLKPMLLRNSIDQSREMETFVNIALTWLN